MKKTGQHLASVKQGVFELILKVSLIFLCMNFSAYCEESKPSFVSFKDMSDNTYFFDQLTNGYSYSYKKKISDYELLGLSEQVKTRGNSYFILLNDVNEQSGARLMGTKDGLAIKAFPDKPAITNMVVFDVITLRRSIREKYGFVEMDKKNMQRIEEALEKQPDDIQLYKEKLSILSNDTVYGEGPWEDYVKTNKTMIDIMFKKEMLNDPRFLFEAQAYLGVLVCLNKEHDIQEFRKKYESRGGQAFDSVFGVAYMAKSVCYMLGISN